MRGKMDTKDHSSLATDSLWATLRTIAVMKSYQRHGIENHPAISSEYVRFLVANTGLGSIAKFKEQFKAVELSITEVAKTAKAAQSAANTAQNTAAEAKKLAKP